MFGRRRIPLPNAGHDRAGIQADLSVEALSELNAVQTQENGHCHLLMLFHSVLAGQNFIQLAAQHLFEVIHFSGHERRVNEIADRVVGCWARGLD